jgi:hypothetical protein
MDIMDFQRVIDEGRDHDRLAKFLRSVKNEFIVQRTVERGHHYSDLSFCHELVVFGVYFPGLYQKYKGIFIDLILYWTSELRSYR